ncbi:MAG: TIGR03915 family putative DNA repair protein, partial [Eubacteriales bacterium]|nr:TIGR03915 family putative DNA repair protein [Eubacteriales bacterium]
CEPSLDGLFSAVHAAWQRDDDIRDIRSTPPAQLDLFTRLEPIETNVEHAQAVLHLLEKKLGAASVTHMALCWLSELPFCGRDILRYAALGLTMGRKLDGMQAHPVVRAVQDTAGKVSFEVHRLSGLLRFEQADGGYYAVVEPDHNILALLSQHFVQRMGDCHWCIEDARRGLYAIHDGGLFFSSHPPEQLLPTGDDPFAALWRTYYDTIAIEGRFNPRLQRRFMPRRYWKHLVENPYGAAQRYLRNRPLDG